MAIQRRKEEGSDQWQDGYPNPDVVQKDIEKEAGFVLTDGETMVGYCAILINDEPEYAKIIMCRVDKRNFLIVNHNSYFSLTSTSLHTSLQTLHRHHHHQQPQP